MHNILNWDKFFQDFINGGDYREFQYNDKILIFCGNQKHSFICIEHSGKVILHENYKSPQELLEKVKIEGKSLQEIWDELILI